MKVSIQQKGTRTTNGTQDWTDAVFSSDVKMGIFWNSAASANDTATANAKLSIGATDGVTNNVSHSVYYATDGIDPNVTATEQRYDGSDCILVSAAAALVKAATSVVLATGYTQNYTTTNATAFLTNGLLVGGSDVTVAVSKGTRAGSTTPVTFNHNLGGVPEIIICQTAISASSDPQALNALTVFTFWTATDTNAYSYSCATTGTTPTDIGSRFSDQDFGRWLQIPGQAAGTTMSISNVTSTSFDLAYSGNPGNTWKHNFWCLKGTTRALAAKIGIFKTPTSTGTSQVITGLPRAASLLMMVGTRYVDAQTADPLSVTEVISTTDMAGCYTFGVACNNASVTQQACAGFSHQDNVATTVSKSRTSATKALMVLDDAGAILTQATVNSWDNSGITLNFDTAAASAYWVQYIAICAPNASGSGTLSVSNQGGF